MWGYESEGGEENGGSIQAVYEGEISGCESFPCEGVYNESDDVQTKSTTKDAIWVVLGSLNE